MPAGDGYKYKVPRQGGEVSLGDTLCGTYRSTRHGGRISELRRSDGWSMSDVIDRFHVADHRIARALKDHDFGAATFKIVAHEIAADSNAPLVHDEQGVPEFARPYVTAIAAVVDKYHAETILGDALERAHLKNLQGADFRKAVLADLRRSLSVVVSNIAIDVVRPLAVRLWWAWPIVRMAVQEFIRKALGL
jgi:hypothetical protein